MLCEDTETGPQREGATWRQRQGWSEAATAEEGLEPPGAGWGLGEMLPGSFGGSRALPVPWAWTLASGTVSISFCGAKPPSLWQFAPAAPGRCPWFRGTTVGLTIYPPKAVWLTSSLGLL